MLKLKNYNIKCNQDRIAHCSSTLSYKWHLGKGEPTFRKCSVILNLHNLYWFYGSKGFFPPHYSSFYITLINIDRKKLNFYTKKRQIKARTKKAETESQPIYLLTYLTTILFSVKKLSVFIFQYVVELPKNCDSIQTSSKVLGGFQTPQPLCSSQFIFNQCFFKNHIHQFCASWSKLLP